eukprot:5104508-Pleurochrysis_carterae.AAC.4
MSSPQFEPPSCAVCKAALVRKVFCISIRRMRSLVLANPPFRFVLLGVQRLAQMNPTQTATL